MKVFYFKNSKLRSKRTIKPFNLKKIKQRTKRTIKAFSLKKIKQRIKRTIKAFSLKILKIKLKKIRIKLIKPAKSNRLKKLNSPSQKSILSPFFILSWQCLSLLYFTEFVENMMKMISISKGQYIKIKFIIKFDCLIFKEKIIINKIKN